MIPCARGIAALVCALAIPAGAMAAQRKIVILGSGLQESKVGHVNAVSMVRADVALSTRPVLPADGPWAARHHSTEHIGYIVNCSIAPVGGVPHGVWEVELRDRHGVLVMAKTGRWQTGYPAYTLQTAWGPHMPAADVDGNRAIVDQATFAEGTLVFRSHGAFGGVARLGCSVEYFLEESGTRFGSDATDLVYGPILWSRLVGSGVYEAALPFTVADVP